MKITNEFTVHTSIDRAWEVLTDLAGVAPCLPGAQLTGVDGDDYKGKVKVKVGPVVSEFTGTARFTEKDAGAYRAVIDAKGRDPRSSGNAAAVVTAVLTPDGEATKVSVDTDLKITGKLAQFGSGMIKEISSKLLTQFATNLEAKLATDLPAPTAVPEPAPTPDTPAPAAVADASDVLGDEPGATVRPDPSAGEVASSAGRTEVATGTPAPVAPLTATPGQTPASAQTPTSAPAATSTIRVTVEDSEPEPLDLLAVAGGSVYKRLVPVAVGAVAVAVVIWLIARR
ncbi:SRPBCC domain-containing protein [Actinoplanes sp. HUAS TT8]|uniref:SRPBCC family protein n=1 Tax=Actinoplanes sp. HUAS TT8 TaxID=3447453 RepID=UPI003F51DB49